MTISSNVIKFPKAAKPKPEPELPWHIHEARWIMGKVEEFNLIRLTKWELAFVASMATWAAHVSPTQHAILKSTGDKVEKQLNKLQPPQPPNLSGPPAA
jgi:hypothetical protein